jgi:hypothetical protein
MEYSLFMNSAIRINMAMLKLNPNMLISDDAGERFMFRQADFV